MKRYKQTYRSWWQIPAKIQERNESREVSFLELFYDLIYVAIVIQLTDVIAKDVTVFSVISYCALFAMVWWAWVNGSLYHELHGNNDIRTRIFTFIQMVLLGGMGVFIADAFGEGYQGFALMYTLFLATVTYLWWRTGVYDPEHRAVSRPYVIGFMGTVVLFALSVFMEPAIAFKLWAVGIGISLVLPFIVMLIDRSQNQEHIDAAQRITPSIVERFGLLTIIILGEGVISTVKGGASFAAPYFLVDIISVLGCFVILILIWWLYFDFVARRIPVQTRAKRFTWLYMHLPVTMAIGLMSGGILHLLKYVSYTEITDRALLVLPICIFIGSVLVLMSTLDYTSGTKKIHSAGAIGCAIAITLLLGSLTIEMGRTQTIVSTALILLIPILCGFHAYTEHLQKSLQSSHKS